MAAGFVVTASQSSTARNIAMHASAARSTALLPVFLAIGDAVSRDSPQGGGVRWPTGTIGDLVRLSISQRALSREVTSGLPGQNLAGGGGGGQAMV